MGNRHDPAPWRLLLEDRTRQAADVLSRVDGVIGLVLSGGMGRGEPWPLSDIDMIPIYEDGRMAAASIELERERGELLDWWAAEGQSTCLDVGKLAFTRSEVARALSLSPAEATGLLDDPRWFHSTDKGYRGRAVFDPEGDAGALAGWFTGARFAPEMVRARLQEHRRQAGTHHEEAMAALGEPGGAPASAVALRKGLHALTRYLMERWGGRDNSWARFGTRLELAAEEQSEEDLVIEAMSLYNLSPEEVARRMAMAPVGIKRRHELSFRGRKLVGETVTKEQDARDVLLVFATRQVRYGPPPYGAWVALETDPTVLARGLDRYKHLLRKLDASGDLSTRRERRFHAERIADPDPC